MTISRLPTTAELAIALDELTTAAGTLQAATMRHADAIGRIEATLAEMRAETRRTHEHLDALAQRAVLTERD